MAHILLIDDDEILRDTVQQMLELDGHRVSTAVDGIEGVIAWQRGRFDLVITDVLMPRQDGTQVIAELRLADERLPIVAISGGRRVLSPEFNLQTAGLVGATSQLAKPFTRAQLREVVNHALAA